MRLDPSSIDRGRPCELSGTASSTVVTRWKLISPSESPMASRARCVRSPDSCQLWALLDVEDLDVRQHGVPSRQCSWASGVNAASVVPSGLSCRRGSGVPARAGARLRARPFSTSDRTVSATFTTAAPWRRCPTHRRFCSKRPAPRGGGEGGFGAVDEFGFDPTCEATRDASYGAPQQDDGRYGDQEAHLGVVLRGDSLPLDVVPRDVV